MNYAWLAIGIFAARFLATAIAYPERDGDLAWQRWLGETILRAHAIPRALGAETFTAAGAPWVPQEWAFSLGAALGSHGVAWIAFSASVALAATCALAIAASHAERLGASPRANALCTALAGVALFASFGVRAQVVAWPLLALFLALLDLESPAAYAAIAVAALWSNLHASALLAPLLAGASAFGAWLDAGRPVAFERVGPHLRRRAAIALGSAVAVCCNPFGFGLPIYALTLFSSPFKSAISEWKATDLGDASFAFGALPLLIGALLFLAGPSPRRARDAIVLVAFAYLVLAATRNVAIFGIAALPIVASALSRRVPFFAAGASAEPDRVARILFPAVACGMAIVVAIGLLRNDERRADTVAFGAMASVAALPGERHVLCGDFAWCGLAVGLPHASVFLDGRADPYPQSVWNDYLSVARVRSRWHATLDARHVDTVVVALDSSLDDALSLRGGWRASYRDAGYRVWVRRPIASR